MQELVLAADLTAVEAIGRLKAAYFRLMDTRDWSPWRDLFTEDCVMTLAGPNPVVLEGREAIRAVNLNDLTNPEALDVARERLAKLGVDRALGRAGARNGDVVHIGGLSFDYESDTDMAVQPFDEAPSDDDLDDFDDFDHVDGEPVGPDEGVEP